MKTSIALYLAIAAVPITFSSQARADDWSETVEFARAQTASVRVVEPEGYTVTINGRTDTLPAVFPVANVNDYFEMKISSPEGATWSKKIEVKEFKQSVVRVKYTKPANAQQPAKSRSFVGTIMNTANTCKPELQMAIGLEFVRGTDVKKSPNVNPGARTNVELVEGAYSIRLYAYDGKQWNFKRTESLNVSKDGWEYEWGCGERKSRR